MGNCNTFCNGQSKEVQQTSEMSLVKASLNKESNTLEIQWYASVQRIIQKCNDESLHKQSKWELKDKQLDIIVQNTLGLKGHILEKIFSFFVSRGLNQNDQIRSQIIKSNTSSFSIQGARRSSKFNSLAQSFIKISDNQNELLSIVDDINKFVDFLTQCLIKLYIEPINTIDDKQLSILIINYMFNFSTFYDGVKAIFNRQFISSQRSYKDHIKLLKEKEFQEFEIEDKDYSESIKLLKEIQQFKSPIDKISILTKSIQLLQLENYDADTLLNIIIYIITKADISHFVTEIKFVEHFSQKITSFGQEGYVLITFMAALSFIIQQQ